jgi:hypothetical protein
MPKVEMGVHWLWGLGRSLRSPKNQPHHPKAGMRLEKTINSVASMRLRVFHEPRAFGSLFASSLFFLLLQLLSNGYKRKP